MRGTRTGQGLVSAAPWGAARPIAYTPVVTWTGNTIGTVSGFYLKTPGLLQVWVSFTETAGVANATLTITVPAGYTTVTHTASLAAGVGTVGRNGVTTGFAPVLWAAAGTLTQVTSSATMTGAVDGWAAFMSIPTLT